MEEITRYVNQVKSFFESIKSEDIVCVLHHTDPDGVCSGVIAAKTFEKFFGRKIDFHIYSSAGLFSTESDIIKKMNEKGITKLIVTDIGIDQSPEAVKEIEKYVDILVIDHHKIYNDLTSEKTIFIKPHFFSEIKPGAYPAAKMCFDIFSKITEISSSDWIAAIGIIGDCGFIEWDSFLQTIFNKYDIEKKDNIFETKLGKVASLISNAESYDIEKASEAFEIVFNANSFKDVLNSSLKNYAEEVESEIEKWIKDTEENAEKENDLIFHLIKSKYKIRGPLSTKLSLRHPNKTIIIVQDMGNEILGISGRRRDEKVAVNELFEQATDGIEGASGGGHIPAAGGRLNKKDFEEFKKKIFELIRNG